GLVINLLVNTRTARRVRQVSENAHRLASGQPLEALPVIADEVGMLARDLEEAAILLRAREKRLSSSESRYRDLFSQGPVPYQEVGRDGVIQRVNHAECRLLGYESGMIVGRSKWDFIATEHQEESRNRFQQAIQSGMDPPPMECEYVLADGSRITMELH